MEHDVGGLVGANNNANMEYDVGESGGADNSLNAGELGGANVIADQLVNY